MGPFNVCGIGWAANDDGHLYVTQLLALVDLTEQSVSSQVLQVTLRFLDPWLLLEVFVTDILVLRTSGDFFSLGPYLGAFGGLFVVFLGFLSKSKLCLNMILGLS